MTGVQTCALPISYRFSGVHPGALVAGVYDREVSVQAILEHGNFGLGTFANLDGEMVVVDGHVYQTKGTGQVSEAPADAGAPFAVVTWFEPETDVSISPIGSFNDLQARCDGFRRSGNIFYVARTNCSFARVLPPRRARSGLRAAPVPQSQWATPP